MRAADRDHEAAAVDQLLEECRRRLLDRGRDEDTVERRLLRPAAHAVADGHADVVVGETGEHRARALGQRGEPLHREDLARQLGQDRCLVAAA